ncbi:spore coat protein CotH, partial [Klebsiella pneumoniae]|nr:spore coat protein CotH [Klebsiella pneumoniae]
TSLRQQLEQDTGSALDGLTALQSGLQSLTAALMQLGLDEMAAQVTSMAASQKSQSDQVQALMLAFQSGMRALALVEATPEEVESHQLSNL